VIHIPLEAKLKCPHCHVAFKSEWQGVPLGHDADAIWQLLYTYCSDCERLIVFLRQFEERARGSDSVARSRQVSELPTRLKAEWMVWPRSVARRPVPTGVPKEIADDYREASLVLAVSSKASAALSRRCLQNLLIEKAGVKKKDLYDQIQEVLDSKQLPSRLADDLDAVRVVGNFGAHPIKSKNTGDIMEVEPGEAEWNLEVLEALFEFHFVEEERSKQRRDALNARLKEAGKPPLR